MAAARLTVRFDRGALPKPRKLDGGETVYVGRVARTGEHVYPWGTERRDEAEIRSIAAQLEGKAVTLTHPAGLIRDGAEHTRVGQVDRAWIDGEHVYAELRVDAQGQAAIDAGVVELSLGYTVESARGEAHRGTAVDHVALVWQGRCGSSCAVRADASEACCLACAVGEKPAAGSRMLHCDCKRGKSRNNVSRRSTSMDEDLKKALADAAAEKARADAAERDAEKARADVAERDKTIAKLEGERDAEKARADAAEQARIDAADDLPRLVKARVKLERLAGDVLDGGDENRFDGKTDREIKVAVVKAVDKVDIDTEKPDAYVDARFDSAIERAASAQAATDAARAAATVPVDQRADGDLSPREKMIRDHQDAWKQPLSSHTA